LAEAGLAAVAPHAHRLLLAPPAGGLPRPLRHRAAIRAVLGVLP
ncbi:MAG: hypothetical protein JWM31_173, partial [Solirubrobacterales bacterium]|nr:hypothetical protein [Solirubrobacterales bacterium]